MPFLGFWNLFIEYIYWIRVLNTFNILSFVLFGIYWGVSDTESREIAREAFRKKKQEKRYKEIGICKKSSFKCEKCDFIGKTEGGLKTHDRIKHREPK